jgi:hypothetical protein
MFNCGQFVLPQQAKFPSLSYFAVRSEVKILPWGWYGGTSRPYSAIIGAASAHSLGTSISVARGGMTNGVLPRDRLSLSVLDLSAHAFTQMRNHQYQIDSFLEQFQCRLPFGAARCHNHSRCTVTLRPSTQTNEVQLNSQRPIEQRLQSYVVGFGAIARPECVGETLRLRPEYRLKL